MSIQLKRQLVSVPLIRRQLRVVELNFKLDKPWHQHIDYVGCINKLFTAVVSTNCLRWCHQQTVYGGGINKLFTAVVSTYCSSSRWKRQHCSVQVRTQWRLSLPWRDECWMRLSLSHLYVCFQAFHNCTRPFFRLPGRKHHNADSSRTDVTAFHHKLLWRC